MHRAQQPPCWRIVSMLPHLQPVHSNGRGATGGQTSTLDTHVLNADNACEHSPGNNLSSSCGPASATEQTHPLPSPTPSLLPLLYYSYTSTNAEHLQNVSVYRRMRHNKMQRPPPQLPVPALPHSANTRDPPPHTHTPHSPGGAVFTHIPHAGLSTQANNS